MLHTLSRSPWHCDIATLLQNIQIGDDLILLQDGVLAAVNNNSLFKNLKEFPITVSVLREDIEARGLVDLTSSKILVINYNDFVNLAIKHTSQMNW